MKTLIEKDFDCVQMVRKERIRIASDTKGKSPDEVLTYFKLRKKVALR